MKTFWMYYSGVVGNDGCFLSPYTLLFLYKIQNRMTWLDFQTVTLIIAGDYYYD